MTQTQAQTQAQVSGLNVQVPLCTRKTRTALLGPSTGSAWLGRAPSSPSSDGATTAAASAPGPFTSYVPAGSRTIAVTPGGMVHSSSTRPPCLCQLACT